MQRNCIAVWTALVGLRLLIALNSSAIIHPDEHFQNPEITVATVFDYGDHNAQQLLRTWEWQGPAPCRSIVPAYISTGLAFQALKRFISGSPTGHELFMAQRFSMWALSLLGDLALWRTSNSPLAVLLYATAPITLTFLVRPFSNALETLALAGLMATAPREQREFTRIRLATIGVIGAFGIFARITFVAFAAPVGLSVMLLAGEKLQKRRSSINRARLTIRRLQPLVYAFLLAALICISIDSSYFSDSLGGTPGRIAFTPVNLLRYNLHSDNLAEHGLHPRYLHVLVNWPMLFGVGIWAVFDVVPSSKSRKQSRSVHGRSSVLYLASFIVPTLLLSIQPHQEPRFLAPLIIPLSLLVPSFSIFSSGTKASRIRREVFWTIWILHSLIFTCLFGFLHQGGLVPALLALNDRFQQVTPDTIHYNVVVWKTFMPPRHLLVPVRHSKPETTTFRVVDLGGVEWCDVMQAFDTIKSANTNSTSMAVHLLVAPAWAVDNLDPSDMTKFERDLRPFFEDDRTFGVHVDMDRLDEMLKSSWARSGVGVWQYSST